MSIFVTGENREIEGEKGRKECMRRVTGGREKRRKEKCGGRVIEGEEKEEWRNVGIMEGKRNEGKEDRKRSKRRDGKIK